jgi:CheY-like chemotaxis protein
LRRERGLTEDTGIGLMVTKKLTELMGSTICVQSNFAVGSEFWVEFKSAKTPATEQCTTGRELQMMPLKVIDDVPFCTVLYLESKKVNVDLVKQILARRSRLQLYGATDGPQGIAMARRHPTRDPDGRSSAWHERPGSPPRPCPRNIPVIAVSANAMPLGVAYGLSAGFFHCLTKPFKN